MLVKDAISVLMKFQSAENIKSLQDGIIYMNPLQYYIDLEKRSTVKFIGDDLEAQARINITNAKIYNSEDKSLFLEFDTGKVIYSTQYKQYPVFCLYNFDLRNCTNEQLSGNILKYEMGFNEKQKEYLHKFHDTVLIIKDKNEFFVRVDRKLNELGITYDIGPVEYYEEDSPQHLKNVIENKRHIAFSKRSEYFELQNEFRILIHKEEKDALKLDIGSIKDISEIIPRDELLERKYEVHITLKD